MIDTATFLLITLLASMVFCDNKGVVELDATSFKKLVGGAHHVLLSLNEFSWKSPENFNDVAEAFKDTADLLVAKVDVSALPDGHALKVSKTPQLRFYAAHDAATHADFAGNPDAAADVIEFVQFQLSPKLKELKSYAASFLTAADDARKAITAKAEALVGSLDAAYEKTGKLYLATMKRIAEKGREFVQTEKKRLTGLVESKSIVADKLKEFKHRLSVLDAFGDL